MERSTSWERVRRLHPLVWDTTLAVIVTAASFGAIVVGPDTAARDLGLLGLAIVSLSCLPLAARRRHPLGVLSIVAAAGTAYAVLRYPSSLSLPLAIATYTAAACEERRRVAMIAAPIALVAGAVIATRDAPITNWLDIAVNTAINVGLPLVFGRIAFNRRRRLALERERAAHDAVVAERSRIARELHDVVAHAMGVMVVQAGGARAVLETDPVEARHALRRVEETGREGLAEMRRLIGILSPEAGDAALAPQPGLARVDELAETIRQAGLPVEIVVEGGARALPAGADLAAYRVVQESLTNSLRHAGKARASVRLRYENDALDVEIADDGRGPPPDGELVDGHGLLGMRERVALFGGSFQTFARPGGGFVVRARFPLPP